MNISDPAAAQLDKLLEQTAEFTDYKDMAHQIQAILPDMNESEQIAMYRQAVTRRGFRILRERADDTQKKHYEQMIRAQKDHDQQIILENTASVEAFSPVLDWIADEISSRLKATPKASS
uniref:Uncharacterized protein n=1 Tax=viral metagenome TaxID=1070528 RepID=A0A6C0CK37_9ZZZZ